MKCIMCGKNLDLDKDLWAEVNVRSLKEIPNMNQMTPENTKLDMENGKAYALQCVTCHGIWLQLIGKHMQDRKLDGWMEGRKWKK